MKITSTLFLLSIGFTVFGKPNVLIIMTDDQGYPEISAHGNPVLQTPNLDRLHGQSLRLSDYHVAPMCTPTRGQLLTGLDAARNGAVNVSSGRALIRAEVPIMANYFGDAGYSTGVFGKWHLGANYPYRPQDRGFQESVWYPSSSIPRFLPIGGMITLTMFTCTTGRKNNSRAIVLMFSLMRPSDSCRNLRKRINHLCATLPPIPPWSLHS